MKKNAIIFLFMCLQPFVLYSQSPGTITGKLVDQFGEGFSGAQLSLYITPNIYQTTSSSNGSFIFSAVTGVKDEKLPIGYSVSQNYPNPFNPKTRIIISLPNSGIVRVDVYNLLGQVVCPEIERSVSAGETYVDLELSGLPNGFYVTRITLDEKYVVTKKLMLMYGSQHLSSSITNNNSFSRLNKTTTGVNSALDTKIDSLVVTHLSIGRKTFANLPNMVGNSLDLSNLTIGLPAQAPALSTPTNLATDISTSPMLGWNASATATSYTLQVSTSNTFSSYVYNQSGLTGTSQSVAGLSNWSTYYWRVSATNTYGTSAYSGTWSFITISGSCPGTPTVTHAGKTYNTVQIGTQCWLKENLNIGIMIQAEQEASNNGVIEKYCYGNNPANCEIYGGLYQWTEAVRGICPTGWHIPTYAELQTLYTLVDKNSNTLKTIGQGTGSGAGTNASGFSALLTGYRMYRLGLGDFDHIGYYTYFWSSTAYNIDLAYTMRLGSNDITTYIGIDTKNLGFSVRCLKN